MPWEAHRMGRWWVAPSLVAAALVSSGCTVDRDPQALTSLADLVADVRGLADAVDDRLDVVREREAAVLAAPCRLPDRLSGIGPGAGFPGVADRLPVDWLSSTGTLRIAVLFVDFPSTPADGESTEQAFYAGFPGAEAYLGDRRSRVQISAARQTMCRSGGVS